MELIDDPAILARAQATFELYRTARTMMRQTLRYRYPLESEAEIERRLVSWLRKDPSPSPRHRRWSDEPLKWISTTPSSDSIKTSESSGSAGLWSAVGRILPDRARTTRDVDVAIVVAGDSEAERITLALRMRGYASHPEGDTLEQIDVNRLATVRLVAPGDNPAVVGVDLLLRRRESRTRSSPLPRSAPSFGRLRPVARIGHLLALKVLAGRGKIGWTPESSGSLPIWRTSALPAIPGADRGARLPSKEGSPR